MYIIIIGAGNVGYNLAKLLSYEKHDLVIVEKDATRHTRAAESLDAQVIQGSGSSYRTLEKAGIHKADMLVAVTNQDEVNLLSCLMAKGYNVPRTIARVQSREFIHEQSPLNAKKLGIDLLIHPESEAATGAIHLLEQSAASHLIEFAGGRIIVLGVQVDRESDILRIPLSELTQQHPELRFRTVAIQRNETTKIPGGNDMFLPNDRAFVAVDKDNIAGLINLFGKENRSIDNVMILGGGQTGYLIAKQLERKCNVKIIESGSEQSEHLAEQLKKALVIKGDGLDYNLLALEGIIDMDAFIAVTGDDETNLVASLMAKHLRVPKIISLINKTEYAPIIPTIGIDAFISKQMLTVNGILRFIRRGQIAGVASLPGTPVEAIEFIARAGSKILKKPLSKTRFPKNVILGAVLREDDVFIPIGDTVIQAGDKVVTFAFPSAIHELEKMFD